MHWNFAHILNKSLIPPISYDNSLWSFVSDKSLWSSDNRPIGLRIYSKYGKIPMHRVQLLIYFLSYTKDYRRNPKFIKEWVIKFRNKYVQKGFLNMKRVWAIAFFFFSMGLFAGFWITHDPMKIVICIGCDIIAYCLFFKWISIER